MSRGYLRTSLARAHRPACETVVVSRRVWSAPFPAHPNFGESLPLLPRGSVQCPNVVSAQGQQRTVTARHAASQAVRTSVTPEAVEPSSPTPPHPAKLRAQPETTQPVAAPTPTKTGSALSTSYDTAAATLPAVQPGVLNGFQRASRGSPPEPEEREGQVAVASIATIIEENAGGVAADPASAGVSSP
jgi:hypothetical protein